MLVSVASVHTELLTPALWFAHVADVACCISHTRRPFATTTVVPESAAVLNMLALLATVMLAVELSADTPLKFAVVAALIDALAFRLAAANLILSPAAAKLVDALIAAAPCLTR